MPKIRIIGAAVKPVKRHKHTDKQTDRLQFYIQVLYKCLARRRRHHINILSSSCIYNKKYVNFIYQHYCIVQCGNGETIFACAKLFLSQVTSLPRMLARKGCAQINALYTYCSYLKNIYTNMDLYYYQVYSSSAKLQNDAAKSDAINKC